MAVNKTISGRLNVVAVTKVSTSGLKMTKAEAIELATMILAVAHMADEIHATYDSEENEVTVRHY